MTDDKGYKDTKEFICTGCGKKIILTKFASQKTCKCEECKANNVPINPDIVAEALQKNPPKERKKSSGGTTKIRPCIQCGKDTEVSKFMSDKKVLCDECKGVTSVKVVNAERLQVNQSAFGNINMPPIEEYEVNSGIIANHRLREVKCPACGHEYMKTMMIIDWSHFGLIIHYQCQECYTTMNLSEQHRRPIIVHGPDRTFDYTGTEIRDLGLSHKESSRIANALCILIKICEDNNINIDDVFKEFSDSVPPYKFENAKPVPKGFVIPPEDEWIHTVHQAYEILKDTNTDVADKLHKLLGGK